jgi:acyl-CoA synthetase (AMP-forming)/AMP-acid ligase II
VEKLTISHALRHVVNISPNRVAVIDNDKSYTYREVDQRIDALVAGLKKVGVKKGDHIGIYLRNCLQYLETAIAASRMQAVYVPINFRFNKKSSTSCKTLKWLPL